MTTAIQVDDRSVLEAFNRLLAVGTEPRSWLSIIGNNLVASTQLRYRESKDPTGAPWAPLSPVTIARRRGGGAGAKPLVDTARLANSVSSRVGNNYVEVGTNVIYARMQQEGATKGAFGRTRRGAPIPWGNIPARVQYGMSIDDRAMTLEVFAEAIERAAA